MVGTCGATYHDVPEHVGDEVVTFETQVEAISRVVAVVDVAILLQAGDKLCCSHSTTVFVSSGAFVVLTFSKVLKPITLR